MAVHLRLLRRGKKKQAYYRIVAADSRFPRDGRFLEVVGTYNPITSPALVKVHEDKMSKWMDEGAQPSDTVRSLLTQVGFIEKYLKAKKGEDVSEIEIKTEITERKKRTRKIKKAALAAEEAAKTAAADKIAAAEKAAADKIAAKKAAAEKAAAEKAEADKAAAEKAAAEKAEADKAAAEAPAEEAPAAESTDEAPPAE